MLIASDKNLTYDKESPSEAYIIETKKDQRGVVASTIIKNGTMKVGDDVYVDGKKMRIRSMINDLGKSVREVVPSTPFELLGFDEMPPVGSRITSAIQSAKVEEQVMAHKTATYEDVFEKKVEERKLALIIKADSQGSLEAITSTLSKNENVNIIMSALGGVHRSDIFLAKTTKAIVIGFSVNIDNEVKELARQEKVIIKTYNIIYELIEELQEVSDLLREKEEQEKNLKAEVKVLATFIIEGETAYGVKVTKGKITVGETAELYRNGNMIGKTRLVSLKIRAKSVSDVKKDQECGMLFSPLLDIKVGDVVKFIL